MCKIKVTSKKFKLCALSANHVLNYSTDNLRTHLIHKLKIESD